MYLSPERTARVFSCVVLRPVLGSVTAKQDRCVPSTIGGSIRWHCSSVPNTTTGLSPNTFICTAEAPGHAGAGFRDRPHHDRGIEDAETRAAIGFGNADAEPAGIRQRLVEVGGIAAFLVLLQPIGIVEPRADFCDRVADRFLVGCEREIHLSQSSGRSRLGHAVAHQCRDLVCGKSGLVQDFARRARSGAAPAASAPLTSPTRSRPPSCCGSCLRSDDRPPERNRSRPDAGPARCFRDRASA